MTPDPRAAPRDEVAFTDLLGEVAEAIAASVPPWRVRLGEAVARWQAEGIATGVLERALRLQEAPDVDGLLEAFEAAVARLRALAREADTLAPSLARHAAFRDPARVAEAAALVVATHGAAAPSAAAVPAAGAPAPVPVPVPVEAECWVHLWPDVGALLIEVDA